MSSLANRKGRPFFIVQSGIVAWEDPEPIADWKRKTVSIVSKTLPAAIDLLWAVVASRSPRTSSIVRLYLAAISPSMTAAQKRRLTTALKTDPPGFAETTVSITSNQACAASTLYDPSAVDPEFLTAYRRCALVEVEENSREPEPFQEACRAIADFGGAGIGALLESVEISRVLRVLELESHAIIQFIGAPEVSDSAIRCLVDLGIRQFNDVRGLAEELASFRQ